MLEIHRSIRAAVLARRPVDARERAAINEFVRRFDALERPFDEHADRVHVTGSAIVIAAAEPVRARGGRHGVLLHRHKRLGLWLQPGGHIDDGELPWDGALREAGEETGLPVRFVDDEPRLVHVDVHPGPRRHIHLDIRYLVEAPPVAPRPPADESQNVQWFQWHQAIAMAEPGLEGVLRALQPGEAKLREARTADARECAQVYVRSREFGLPEVPNVHDPAEIRRWMADEVIGRSDMWVAEVDGTIAGQMVLDHDRDGSWMNHLYLDPSWIGRGLGDRFVQLAKERSPEGIQLWTFQVNGGARRFYERHGFVAEERTDGSGNEERAPDTRYRWSPG